eukprot:EG_transcript_17116
MSVVETPPLRLAVQVGRPPSAETARQQEKSPACSTGRVSLISPSSLASPSSVGSSWILGSVEPPPDSLADFHCETRPTHLPTGPTDLQPYEALVWLLVYLAFNAELPLTRDLYKPKTPQGIRSLEFPEDPAQWRSVAHVMRSFNVHFAPRKYLAWARAARTAPKGRLSRERRCFAKWFAVTENNVDGYKWLRVRMGVDPPAETASAPEEDPTPFCREIVISLADLVDEYSDACALVRSWSSGVLGLENYLNVSLLGIPALPPQVFELFGLVEIQARCNSILTLPPEIGNLPCLEVLFLSHNRLRRLPKEIAGCARLHRLALDHNCLEELPEELGHCQHLRMLNCNFNRLRTVPSSLGSCERLEEVYLSN